MKITRYMSLLTLILSFSLSQASLAQQFGLEYEYLFEIKASLSTPIEVGKTPLGRRTIFPIGGGVVEGPRINGRVLPNGGDWLLRLNARTSKIDVRAVIETDEGDIIYSSYNGYIHTNNDGTLYFRANPVFETSSKKYNYLNHTIAIGVGRFIDGGVAYSVYAIK